MIAAVICTYNGRERVGRAIAALLAASRPCPLELVVVDNASTDGTAAVVATAFTATAAPDVATRLVSEPRAGLSHARRAGALATTAETVLFVDDDNVVDPGFLARLHGIVAQTPRPFVIGAHGVPEAVGGELPPWFAAQSRWYALGPQRPVGGPTTTYYGACLAFDGPMLRGLMASAFQPVLTGRSGALQLAGDDTELCLAAQVLGAAFRADDRLLFRHLMPAGRLTEERLCAMHEGFGAAELVMALYIDEMPGLDLARRTLYAWRASPMRRPLVACRRSLLRRRAGLAPRVATAHFSGWLAAMGRRPEFLAAVKANLRTWIGLRVTGWSQQ